MTHAQLIRLVRREMAAQGVTPYRLHMMLKGKVSKQTVYNFVTHGACVHSDILLDVLNLLGLAVAPGKGSKINQPVPRK